MGRAYALELKVYVGTSTMLAVRAREFLLLPKALLLPTFHFILNSNTFQGHG